MNEPVVPPDDSPDEPSPSILSDVLGDQAAVRPPADDGAKSRLRWRCRRGMRELDQAMLAYLDHSWDDASPEERAVFEELLDHQEPALYALVTGKDTEVRYQAIIDKIARTLGGEDAPAPST